MRAEILQHGVINNMADENIYDEFKEAIPVMSGDTMDIAIDEAFAPIGQSNSELNHAVLNNRDIPNQHPIIAIEGLRDELNNIENLKTEYSDEMGFANYYPWEDGGDSKYSRIGYFVTVADRERRIKICTESDEVFGVTVVTAGFIGNQDGIPDNDDYSKYGTKKGSNCGVECGLVAHSGVVNVHCRSDVVKGSHVICDGDGYAKVVPEEDGGYGFKVIGIDWKNGEKYAVISLDASINQLHALGKEALEIRTRMTGLEKNVTTAVNAANQALSKVNEIGEVSQGVAGKVDEIANVVDKNNQQIADTTNKVNQAVQQAQQAQQVAQEISNQVVENAKVEIQQLKDDVSKAQDVANTAKSTAEGAFLAAQNTKDEIQTNINTIIGDTLKENEEYNKTVIEIQDLKASLNKAYKKIQSWNSSDNTYTSLDGKENQSSNINTVYDDGTNYYYYKDGNWRSTTKISDTGLIASIAGMQKQVDENGAQITSFAKWKGEAAESIAAIEQKANEDGSMIDLLCSYTGDNYEKVKSFNPANNNNDIKKIYYNEADRKFYYYKNGWKSTTKSYEAGITDAIANLKMIANDKESMTQILNTYIGKNVVDAVMCDSQPNSLNMKPGVKYVYKNEDSYICTYLIINETTSEIRSQSYPSEAEMDTISNVVLNAVKEIGDYITVDMWTNEREDDTNHTPIYYVRNQDKYYHWDDTKSAWLPMDVNFYFTYDADAQSWVLQDPSSISPIMKAISMIQSRADANGARLDILLSGNKDDDSSLAAMIAKATGDKASMQMLTQWVDKSLMIRVDEFNENIEGENKVYSITIGDKEYSPDENKVYYIDPRNEEYSPANLILMPYDDDNNGEIKPTNGVYFKANLDGSVDIWGTAEQDAYYDMRCQDKTQFIVPKGSYVAGLIGNLDLTGQYRSVLLSTNLYTDEIRYGNPITFEVSEPTKTFVRLVAVKGKFNNVSENNPIRVYPILKQGSELGEYSIPKFKSGSNTSDSDMINFYYYYSNDHWLSTTDPSVAGVSNSLATLKVKSDKHGGQIEGLVKDTGELGTKLSRFTQKADGIESLVANIDKYSVGECSQAYGLSLEQANNILYDGMIFVPLVDTSETYDFVIEELTQEEYVVAAGAYIKGQLNEEFKDKDKKKKYHFCIEDDNFYFFYDGTKWSFQNDDPKGFKQSFSTNHVYKWGDNEAYGCKTWIDTGETALVTITTTEPEAAISGQFWYYNGSVPISITNSETGETRELYKPKALYKCVTDETDSTIKYWTFVTSADDNSIARSLSQIRQKSNEIALEVSDAKGSVAALKNTVDEFGAHTSLIVGKDGKVKAYIIGNATDGRSDWQIGANNINIDGTITVTNTYVEGPGAFYIYDFHKPNPNSEISQINYWLKADYNGTTPFSVNEYGKLTATNADITGKITATELLITTKANETKNFESYVDGKLAVCVTTDDNGVVQSAIQLKGNKISIESNNFTLSNEGDITATSGLIGGWSIETTKLYNDFAELREEIYVGEWDITTDTYTTLNDLVKHNMYEDYVCRKNTPDKSLCYKEFNPFDLTHPYRYYYYLGEEWKSFSMSPNHRITITGNDVTKSDFLNIDYLDIESNIKNKLFKVDKAGNLFAQSIYGRNFKCGEWRYFNDINNYINDFPFTVIDTDSDDALQGIKYQEFFITANERYISKDKVYLLSDKTYCFYDRYDDIWKQTTTSPYSYLSLNTPFSGNTCIELVRCDFNGDEDSPFWVDFDGRLCSNGLSVCCKATPKDNIRYSFDISSKQWSYGTNKTHDNIIAPALRDCITSKGGFVLDANGGHNGMTLCASSIHLIGGPAYIYDANFNKINVTSTEDIKTNISSVQNVLSLFTPENSSIYNYNLKSEVATSNTNDETTGSDTTEITTNSQNIEIISDESNVHYGFVIGDGYNTPSEVLSSDGKHIDLYSMASINWKATQELLAKITELENTIKQLTKTQ